MALLKIKHVQLKLLVLF